MYAWNMKITNLPNDLFLGEIASRLNRSNRFSYGLSSKRNPLRAESEARIQHAKETMLYAFANTIRALSSFGYIRSVDRFLRSLSTDAARFKKTGDNYWTVTSPYFNMNIRLLLPGWSNGIETFRVAGIITSRSKPDSYIEIGTSYTFPLTLSILSSKNWPTSLRKPLVAGLQGKSMNNATIHNNVQHKYKNVYKVWKL